MTIILIALSAGIVTWLGFFYADRLTMRHRHTNTPLEGQGVQHEAQRGHKLVVKQSKQQEGLQQERSSASREGMESSTSFTPTDYATYHLSALERIITTGLGCFCAYIVGYLFYQHLFVAGCLASIGLCYPWIWRKQRIRQRQQELTMQFKQALYALSSSLAAGKSVENAFRDVVQDLQLLYPDPNTAIIREFEWMNNQIANGQPIELVLRQCSQRAHNEDIQNFADVFAICKRTGGDLVEVIRSTSTMINEKLDVQQEIQVLIAQKKLEAKILGLAPLFIIGALALGSPDYMAPLYEKGLGPIVMTIALLLLGLSYWITLKIMDIKV